MSDGPVQFKGKIFYIGKYRIGLWWTLLDVSDGCNGRVYFFWWHPIRWRHRVKGIKKNGL